MSRKVRRHLTMILSNKLLTFTMLVESVAVSSRNMS
ncbi:Uncharacterised protein [Streptococcus pyogenes]|nr:Uncharacterised protein [Streptococcus pyogenes]